MIAVWRTIVARARLYTAEWGALATQPSFAEEHARIISACRNKDVHHAQQSLDNALRLEAGAMSGDGDGEPPGRVTMAAGCWTARRSALRLVPGVIAACHRPAWATLCTATAAGRCNRYNRQPADAQSPAGARPASPPIVAANGRQF